MVPAMLAVAEAKNLSGKEFLKGLAIGSELICRLALVAPTAVHRQGFHPTAIFGAFGAFENKTFDKYCSLKSSMYL